MLAELLVAVAVAVAPAAVPAAPAAVDRGVEGAVVWKWYDAAEPAFLWMPAKPECWGMNVQPPGIWSNRVSICVDEATWKRTPLFSYYRGGA